jgi:hypothetical protein
MKTCVVRRRFYSTEADNRTVTVELEPGFGTPKAAIILYTENNAATDSFDTTLEYKNFGVGFSDGTNRNVIDFTFRDNQAASDTQISHSNSNFISAVNSDRGTTHYRVATVSFVQDKINLTFTDTTPQTNGHLEALFWVISGDDVSAAVGFSSYNTTSGNSRVYSQLAFAPDLVFISGGLTSLNQTASTDAIFSLGVAKRTTGQQCNTAFWNDDAADPFALATRVSNNSINAYISAAASVVSATIGSFSANGWTMTNVGTFAADRVYNFLAIKSANPDNDFALFTDFDTFTGTGRTFVGLGSTGFPPDTLIGSLSYASTRNAIQTTVATGAASLNFFAGTATSYSKLFNGTGTITYSTANATVSGTGTSFFYFYPGVKLYTLDGGEIGTVSSVTNATSLTLAANSLITGTAQTFTHSNFRQNTISITEFDGDNNTTTSNTLISSQMFTIPTQNTVEFQAYLDTPDTSNGFFYNVTNADATSRVGWVLASNDSRNLNRRRGSLG